MRASQLERIPDWALLAREAGYRAPDLATLNGVSLRQLERFFIEHFRRPPQEWLDELRLIKAAQLLVRGSRVKEVATQMGFRNGSHFSKRFERYHGCRPSEFVRIHDRRLAERKRKFKTWFPDEEIPEKWLADPSLAKPWEALLQRRTHSSS